MISNVTAAAALFPLIQLINSILINQIAEIWIQCRKLNQIKQIELIYRLIDAELKRK